MATNTQNLNLIKPGGSDRVQISQINQNMDIIDEKIGTVGNTSLQGQIAATNGLINSLKTQLAIPPAFSGDCNNITETSVAYTTDTATHSPGPWNILTTVVFNNAAISQQAIDVTNGVMRTRGKSSNGWSEWNAINDRSYTTPYYRDHANSNSYAFNIVSDNTQSSYRLAVLFQNESGHPAMHLISIGVGSSPEITLIKILGDDRSRSPTSVTLSDNVLTIAYSDIAYGGITLLWLN